MKPLPRLSVLFLLAFLSLLRLMDPESVMAQEKQYTIVIRDGGRPLVVSCPEPIANVPADLRDATTTMSEVLFADLESCGLFRMVDREYYRLVKGYTDPVKPDFLNWREIGTEILVTLSSYTENGGLMTEARVFDLSAQRQVLGKRFSDNAEPKRPRLVGHTVADMIIRFFGGRKSATLSKIAFISDRTGAKELHIMDYDGYNIQRITFTNFLNLSPDWSPDGKSISYVSYRRGASGILNPNIYILDQGKNTPIPFATELGLNSTPTWAPDGKSLAFTRSVRGNAELFMANRDGSGLKRLTTSRGIDTSPTWAPSGKLMAFVSDRSGSPQIYLMSPEGTNLRRITFKGENDSPAWSPDGERIAFCTRFGGNYDIYMYDVETESIVQLTQNAGANESPTWSPDSRQLAFVSTRGGKKDIYLMLADGSNQRRITRTGNNFQPSWSQ